jgi:hypothetical protein
LVCSEQTVLRLPDSEPVFDYAMLLLLPSSDGDFSREALSVNGERQCLRQESGTSVTKQFVTWVGLVSGAMAIFWLAILIADKPFGLQITALIGYTGFVFFQLFCDSRAFKGYGLRLTAVRQKIPTLLAIHAVFLLVVFIALTAALSVRPHVLSSWHITNGKRGNSFDTLLIMVGVTICMGRTLISRKILSRSIDTDGNAMNTSP